MPHTKARKPSPNRDSSIGGRLGKHMCQPLHHALFPFPVYAQNGIVLHGKLHTRSAPSLSNLPEDAVHRVHMLVWLNTGRPRCPGIAQLLSFCQASSALLLWSFPCSKALQASRHSCPATKQTSCTVCSACQADKETDRRSRAVQGKETRRTKRVMDRRHD